MAAEEQEEMQIKKINENEYEVFVFDWIDLFDHYVCGHIKRQPNEYKASSLCFWKFYPTGSKKPLSARVLMHISKFIDEVNLTY